MAKKPDKVLINLMTAHPLKLKPGLEKLLAALEEIGELQPTHWGEDERAPNIYNHDDLVTTVSGLLTDVNMPGIHRREPPKYEAFFSAKDPGLKDFELEFRSQLRKKDLPLIFDLGTGLADALTPEFGFVHPIWRLGETSQSYSASGILKASELNKYGPRAICARTWLGAHLVDLIGRERLESTGAIIKDTSWGGVEIDLVEKPWASDFEELQQTQIEVMNHLSESRVFGDYTELFKPKPGDNWQPIE